MFGIRHVGAGLIPDADGIQSDQHGVHEDGENRIEDVGDEHDALHQEQEEREDGDDDIELGGAERGECQQITSPGPRARRNLTMPPMATDSEQADSWHSHR